MRKGDKKQVFHGERLVEGHDADTQCLYTTKTESFGTPSNRTVEHPPRGAWRGQTPRGDGKFNALDPFEHVSNSVSQKCLILSPSIGLL